MASFTTTASHARKAFFKRLRWYIVTSSTLLVIMGITALITRSPLFKVTTIEVIGIPQDAQSGLVQEIKRSLLHMQKTALLGTDNYFSWPTDFTYNASVATSITMEKSVWDKKVTLTATPRERYAVWCTDQSSTTESCSWIDGLGVAFAQAPATEGQLVRTIYNQTPAGQPLEGRPIVHADTFSIIKKIIDGIATLPIDIVKTTYNDETQELQFYTDYGTLVRFSTRFDPTATVLPALRKIIDKPGLNTLEYLNLTVENRAFLKYK